MSETGDSRDARTPGETPDGPPPDGPPAEPGPTVPPAAEPGPAASPAAGRVTPWSTSSDPAAAPAEATRPAPRGTTAGDWLGALVVAVVAYGSMLVAAAAITVVMAAMLNGGAGGAPTWLVGDGSLPGRFGVYPFVALLFQLVAMAMGGTLSLQLAQNIMGEGATTSASLHGVPLLVTLAGLVVLFLASRAHARRQVRRGARPDGFRIWLTALITGVVLAALAVGLSILLAGRGTLAISIISLEYRFDAVDLQLALFPLIAGTLVAGWGRQCAAGAEGGLLAGTVRNLAPGLGTAVRLCGRYAGGVALAGLVGLTVLAFVHHSPATGLATLFFGLTAVVEVMALGHLSGLTAQTTARLGYQQDTAYIWSGAIQQYTGLWPMLIWVAIGVGILWLALSWSRRRPRTAMATSWFAMPLAFLLLGLALQWAGTVRFADNGFVLQGFYGLAPAWWTPVCLLGWGVVVELLARFVAPLLGRRGRDGRRSERAADAAAG